MTLPERFVSVESGALVRGINGETPVPPGRKVRTAEHGVARLPTLLSNAETFAQLAVAAPLGPRGDATVGTPREPGTLLPTVSGPAEMPASVVEAPAGVPLRAILRLCGVGSGAGVLVGGYRGAWITTDAVSGLEVSRAALAAVGACSAPASWRSI